MPINRLVAADADLEAITEAVIYFTGCLIDIEHQPNGKIRVMAAGYYSQIGA